MKFESISILYTTLPSRETAQNIASELLNERLAACVNIFGSFTSSYSWKGNLETAEEFALIVKTTNDLAERTTAKLAAMHPYEVPAIIKLHSAEASKAYHEWMLSTLRPN